MPWGFALAHRPNIRRVCRQSRRPREAIQNNVDRAPSFIPKSRQPHKVMKKACLLGLALLGSGILIARADIIPTLSSVTGSSPTFTWNYSANVTVNETVNTGDFFTIYDFSSIMPTTTTQPAGWAFSTALVGPTAALTTPTDSASLWNLTWTYSGAPIAGSAALGIFSAVTNTDQLKTGQFTAEATRSNDPTNTKVSNIGSVSVPVPESTTLFPIIGVCAAALFSRMLRRQRA